MNERTFKAKLRAMIKPHTFIQSMSSLATAGTPDLWISDIKDLWLEVKWDETTKGPIKPKLSALQEFWCSSRHDEGRNVMVIVGVDSKTAILYKNKNWKFHHNDRRPLKDIIEEILQVVNQ